MEIEPYYSFGPQKRKLENFSCLQNKSSIESISYTRARHNSTESFLIPRVSISSAGQHHQQSKDLYVNVKNKVPPVSSSSSSSSSAGSMVVDLQSHTPCVVTADPTSQSSPHDYKMMAHDISPRQGAQDYKLHPQHLSPQAAMQEYKYRQPDHSPHAHLSPRNTELSLNRQHSEQQLSPHVSCDLELTNQNVSPRANHRAEVSPLPLEGGDKMDKSPGLENTATTQGEIVSKLDPSSMAPPHKLENKFIFGATGSDFDGLDRGSNSSSPSCHSPEKHRNRRKQTIEDIVRRMRNVENGYGSNDSEEEELDDDELEEANEMMMAMQNQHKAQQGYGQDEVDGAPMRMPTLEPEDMEQEPHIDRDHEVEEDDRKPSQTQSGLDEKGSLVNGNTHMDTENIHPDNQNIKRESKFGNGMELSPDHKQINAIMEKVAEITSGKPGHDLFNPQKMNSWFSGGFGNFPVPFSFPSTPLDHHLSPGLFPRMDGKFSSPQEVEKDYLKCQYCERTFRRQKNLENHVENTHHGKGGVRRKSEGAQSDMYFKCNHCPYTTKHQSNLYVHLRIHTGERPYICGACGVQYSQSHSLKSHIINKHDGIMSYYIKEKRNRSPRGIGYLTHVVPDMYKIPGQPPTMVPHSMAPTHHHSPTQANLLMPQHNLPLPPNASGLAALHQQIMASPHHGGQMPNAMMSPMQKMMLSPQQQQLLGNGSQQHNQQQQENKPSPPGQGMDARMPGHPNMSHFNHLQPPHQQMNPIPKSSPNGYPVSSQQISPSYSNNNNNNSGVFSHMKMRQTLHEDQPLSLVTTPTHRPQMPLQEISNNHMEEGNSNHGAIDLTKKPGSGQTSPAAKQTSPMVGAALKSLEEMSRSEKPARENHSCENDGQSGPCVECVHANKLKTLRLNVVRMLSILVPNLNFEEKGISAEGDSVDELLHDVIESNIQDEEMSD